MPKFSKTSKTRLSTCASDLQRLFNAVVKTYDCTILEGHRDPKRQEKLYFTGKSKIKRGKHNDTPSNAVDVSPYPIPNKWGEDNFKELAKFYHFAGFVLAKAEELKIKIRWGGDWDSDKEFTDQNFNDLVHFELL